MKHLFSSGEILTKQNAKALGEGTLIGDSLEYAEVKLDTEYMCHGEMDGKRVTVSFRICEEGFQVAEFRHRIGILMQSDIFEADWTEYRIAEGD